MSDSNTKIPTLYEWIGGEDALARLMQRFYEKVPNDPVLAPVFKNFTSDHAQYVALFIAEVFAGPKKYSAELGGHAGMVRHHFGRNITEEQRRRWVNLLLDTVDELNLPSDPEFRSALVAYLEWGSRLAVINSASPVGTQLEDSPMPEWNWGVPGGPFQPKE